ncbi:MAG: hypothetical protein IKA79_00665 [Lentisphaeria bacterium]|nr:hypothetical protein [Lentisphaeria bacterium]
MMVYADRAGNLREYEEVLGRVSENYKGALRAPESRFGQDYEKALRRLWEAGQDLQKDARYWGKDFNFMTLSLDIGNLYKQTRDFLKYRKDGSRNNTLRDRDLRDDSRNRRHRSYNSYNSYNRNSSSGRYNTRVRGGRVDHEDRSAEFFAKHNPLPIINILLDDLRELRKSGFLESASGRNASKSQRVISEYKRLVDFYMRHYRRYLFDVNSMFYMKEVKRRGNLLLYDSRTVMDMCGRRNGGELPCNLMTETATLLRVTGFQAADTAKAGRRGKDIDSPHNRQEAQYSLSKINETVGLLRRDFVMTPGKAAVRSTTVLAKIEEKEDPDEAGLKKQLYMIRKKIFEGNTMLSGVDRETVRKFRLTLSKEELKEFERIRKEYLKHGYDSTFAARYACTQLLNRDISVRDTAELKRLYEKVRKALMQEAEKKMDL